MNKLVPTYYLYVLPCLAVILVFIYWPILYSVILSFQRWDFLLPQPQFVGVKNYLTLASEDDFWRALRTTSLFAVVAVPLRLSIALALALFLYGESRFDRVLRGMFFMPAVLSSVAIAIVWDWMYNTEFGLLNALLRAVGLGSVPWLTSPDVAIYSVALVDTWQQLGYDLVLYIAGLQAIPTSLTEAAQLDGAGRWRRFLTIQLPLLMPTTFFLLIISVINSFQVFTLVSVMTEGGPARATEVIVFYLYRLSFINFNIGLGSAVAVVLFAVLLVLTAIQFGLVGRKVHYGYD